MEAFKSNILEYMNGTRQYSIPIYQRAYSWKSEQCQRLWSDIELMHNENKKGHFVGSIVRIDEVSAAGFPKAMIIDGQQRLTTLTILLIALRDYIRTHNIQSNITDAEIMDTALINPHKKENDRYKLILTKTNQEELQILIENLDKPNNLKSSLFDNHSFFLNKIIDSSLSPDEIYQALGKLQMVDISLDRKYDDPQAIFESLNSTGMDLKDSDLIRNYLLMELDIDNQVEIYNTIWQPLEKLFDYQHRSELLDNFFRDYLTMKLTRIPKKNEIYKELRSYHKEYEINIRELCDNLYKFAIIYTNIYFVRSNDIILKTLYKDIKSIKMDVAYPFLLQVHDDFSNGLITIQELQDIVGLCISYVLRRAICDIPTNSLNKTFATLKNEINKHDYLNSIKATFILMDSYKEFPNDEKFFSVFINRDIYNLNRCKYILSKIENFENKSIVNIDNLTIEHIVPQNPKLSNEWINELGENWKEIQQQFLHTIGNLTLTAYNAELSDLPFCQKLERDGGFKESALKINKYVVAQTTWNSKKIIERANIIGEIAKKIWAYPTLTEQQLYPYIKQESLAPQYTLDSYSQWNEQNKILFDCLNTRIMNLGSFIKREFKKLYIAYKADTNFVDIVIQKSRLRLSINMKFSDVIDPKSICHDVTEIGRWGNGDVELFFSNLDEIDDVMDIIEQSLQLQEMG